MRQAKNFSGDAHPKNPNARNWRMWVTYRFSTIPMVVSAAIPGLHTMRHMSGANHGLCNQSLLASSSVNNQARVKEISRKVTMAWIFTLAGIISLSLV